jgi:carboxyl-terminal processing protease
MKANATLAKALMLSVAVAALPASVSAFSAVEATTQDKFAPLFAVYQRVKADYVEPVEDEKLVEGAIAGMLDSLDPHSAYLDAKDFDSLRTQTDGEYGGLGLQVSTEQDAVKVIAPFKDTPADRAGIKPGDYITHLDGKLIIGQPLDESVKMMKGTPGTNITLTVIREGRDKPFDVTVTREIIDLKPVTWEVKDNVGIITVSSFSEDTGRDVASAIKGIESELGGKPNGIIVDLRSNPGGLLGEAVRMSDVFLDKGVIVSQKGRRPRESATYSARKGDLAAGIPIIVLIDSGSASASEIVAGALQDHHRAIVMGEQSFGKGSVQSVLPLTQTTGLRLTTARYYTPSGKSVQEGGIKPDIRVPQLSDPDYKTRPRFREVDLSRHLANEKGLDDAKLMQDDKDDPRFAMTQDQLKAKGIEDFQLWYAIDTLNRGKPAPTRTAAKGK